MASPVSHGVEHFDGKFVNTMNSQWDAINGPLLIAREAELVQSCDEIIKSSKPLCAEEETHYWVRISLLSVSYFKAGLFLHTCLHPTSSKLWLGYSFRYDCLASPNASETAPASELSFDQFPTACDWLWPKNIWKSSLTWLLVYFVCVLADELHRK